MTTVQEIIGHDISKHLKKLGHDTSKIIETSGNVVLGGASDFRTTLIIISDTTIEIDAAKLCVQYELNDPDCIRQVYKTLNKLLPCQTSPPTKPNLNAAGPPSPVN